jgi:Domain of unknown function (DUF4276)
VTTGDLRLEVLVEERSAVRVLDTLIPKIIPGISFVIREVPGKTRLLKELPNRLKGYANQLTFMRLKIVVLVDRDDDDCVELKRTLDGLAATAGLSTAATASKDFVLLNRIVIEELEAWFLGDVPALCAAYPRLPESLGQQARFRDPDAIRGGTWEALRDVLQKYGYHTSGFRKLELATDVAPHMDVESNRSTSFQVFRDGPRRLVSEGTYAQED